MTPRVLNIRQTGVPVGAGYVGRSSRWGNPYSHMGGTRAQFKVATREEAIKLFRLSILQSNDPYREEFLAPLRGKDLVCWCAPKPCHADVLLELVNTTQRRIDA